MSFTISVNLTCILYLYMERLKIKTCNRVSRFAMFMDFYDLGPSPKTITTLRKYNFEMAPIARIHVTAEVTNESVAKGTYTTNADITATRNYTTTGKGYQ